MKGETTALCSKTRVTFANNSNLQKQEQNSQYFEIKLDTQNFLYNIRQSLVYCYGKKLISTRLELASTHIEAIIDGVVSYLYEFPLVPGGGTLGISGWGCAAGTLEPLTYTRAS